MDNQDEGPFQLGEPLKEGQVYVAAIEVVGFITEEGKQAYRIRKDVDAPISYVVGLMELAKMQFMIENGVFE